MTMQDIQKVIKWAVCSSMNTVRRKKREKSHILYLMQNVYLK